MPYLDRAAGEAVLSQLEAFLTAAREAALSGGANVVADRGRLARVDGWKQTGRVGASLAHRTDEV